MSNKTVPVYSSTYLFCLKIILAETEEFEKAGPGYGDF